MKIGYDREKSESYGEKYGAVILAAGLSSRMKAFKPLLPVAGSTAVEGLIESARAAGISDITVVSGHNREELEAVLKTADVNIAYNPDYETGMLSSIKTGLRAASASGKEGYLLMPVDCPLISVRVMREIMGQEVGQGVGGGVWRGA
ncbi:MAG: NTP transferase domain-containing protein [Bacillota bacterium]|nr:NTP transferase domain-containing protein [Bacillota bacterium]